MATSYGKKSVHYTIEAIIRLLDGVIAADSIVDESFENGLLEYQNNPHVLLFPCLIISLLMISFNLFGNGLRDAFNTSLKGSEE